jgi:hypothetical protein
MVDFVTLFKVAWIASVIIAAISAISTGCTLVLIRDINRWNTYMKLIFNLTACQMLSDVAFFFVPVDLELTLYFQLQVFFYTFGAVSVSLWTNLVSCSLLWVVVVQENLPINENFGVVRVMVLVPGFVLGIFFAVLVNKNYDTVVSIVIWTLMLSIVFNVAVHCTVSYVLYKMRLVDEEECRALSIDTSSAEGGEGARLSGPPAAEVRPSYPAKINVYEPVMELARRLQYYPIIQIVAILGQLWYFLEYNLEYFGPKHNETLKLVSYFMYCVLTPSTGLGYFLVFLAVQPYAYAHFCTRLRQIFGIKVERQMSIQSDTSYREPSSTAIRVTETTDLPPRFSNYSADSSATGSTGLGWSHFTATTVSTMDEDALMRRIRDTQRANLDLHEKSHRRSVSEVSSGPRSSSSLSVPGQVAMSPTGNPVHIVANAPLPPPGEDRL